MDKQVQPGELQPGSLNQVMFGSVLTFPVKDVSVDITDMTPLASDNSTVKDFDLQVIYSVNPSSVAELYVKKSRSFHADSESGDVMLMYNYVRQLGRNAAYKVARQYESLKLADNRAEIEQKIRAEIIQQLHAENLADAINVSQVLVRSILPADNIVNSANALVQAQNEQRLKEVEVSTAKLEAVCLTISKVSLTQDDKS
jgi:regulator of protease activity HflC (stomatin/prohibitin superfamily)